MSSGKFVTLVLLLYGCGGVVSVGSDASADAAFDALATDDGKADSPGDAGGLINNCGGRVCRGTCWPTADQCSCNGLAGGCPEATMCCSGHAVCQAECAR